MSWSSDLTKDPTALLTGTLKRRSQCEELPLFPTSCNIYYIIQVVGFSLALFFEVDKLGDRANKDCAFEHGSCRSEGLLCGNLGRK